MPTARSRPAGSSPAFASEVPKRLPVSSRNATRAAELAAGPPVELVERPLERGVRGDGDDEDVGLDVPRLIGDDTKLHGGVDPPGLGGRVVRVSADGRHVAGRWRDIARSVASGRRPGTAVRCQPGGVRSAEGVGEPAAGLLDGDDGAVHPAPPDLRHDHDQAARIRWQPLLGGLLGRDRVADLVGDPAADVAERDVQVAQGRVVGGVAVQPLVQDGHVDRGGQPVAQRRGPRRSRPRRPRGSRRPSSYSASRPCSAALSDGRVVLRQTRRQPARRDRPDRQPGPRRVEVRGGVERVHAAGAWRSWTPGETWKSASGVPMNGVASSVARMRRGPIADGRHERVAAGRWPPRPSRGRCR